jgi:rod shape-determining protein MreD
VIRAARLSVVLAAAVLAHTAVLPHLRVAGVAAEALLAVAVAAGLVAGPHRGALVGFVAGTLADCFLATPFGLSALTYTLVGHGVGAVQGRVAHATPWVPPVAAALASGAGAMLFAVLGAVLGQPRLLDGHLATVVGVVAVTGAVLVPLVLRPLRWALVVPLAGGGRRW